MRRRSEQRIERMNEQRNEKEMKEWRNVLPINDPQTARMN